MATNVVKITDYKITDVEIVNPMPANVDTRLLFELQEKIRGDIERAFLIPAHILEEKPWHETTWPAKEPSLRCEKCGGFVICICCA